MTHVLEEHIPARVLAVEWITARSAIDARIALADTRDLRGLIVLHVVYLAVHGDHSEWIDHYDIYQDQRLLVAGILGRDDVIAYLATLGVDVSDGSKVKGDYGYPRGRQGGN